RITVGGKDVLKVMLSYGDGGPNEPFGILGSAGLLEISVNRGSAARTLGAQRGAEVTVELL
ncbi:MAG TPA: SAM hydroxide adenosyltransferase, partial [Candidatus Acidoferrales bacterium]|nr:SAM hydroxide adenosyltransferase [Candidatus Acidoferrales bacterium]